VTDLRGLAIIAQTSAHRFGQPKPEIGFLDQEQPAIGADITAIESGRDLFPMKESEAELVNTLCHTGETSRNTDSIGVEAYFAVSPVFLPEVRE
jgi:hypothetical protein